MKHCKKCGRMTEHVNIFSGNPICYDPNCGHVGNESPWTKEIPTEPGAIHLAIRADNSKCIVMISDVPSVLTGWVLYRDTTNGGQYFERLESFKWWGPRINFPAPPEDDQ